MIRHLFRRVFPGPQVVALRQRLHSVERPEVIYAIGDVHGCLAELRELETRIVLDAAPLTGEKWLVMLGDYVDRGPASAAVLDHLIAPPPRGFRRVSLAGNHEVMMLQFLDNPALDADWLRFGGVETLASYGIDAEAFRRASISARRAILASHIPQEHIEFLTGLPILLSVPGVNFVHAGLRPGIELDEQDDQDLLWIREPFLSGSEQLPALTVHGHTPQQAPSHGNRRIGIDTGAYASGVLTAARIDGADNVSFLSTQPYADRGNAIRP